MELQSCINQCLYSCALNIEQNFNKRLKLTDKQRGQTDQVNNVMEGLMIIYLIKE